jgi:hypothetical protein
MVPVLGGKRDTLILVFMGALLLFVTLQPAHKIVIPSAQAQTEVATSAFISVEPNPAEFDQNPVQVTIQIVPAPPTPTDIFQRINVTFTRPDGGIIENHYSSNTSGSHSFNIYLSMVGNWTINLRFEGQSFDNDINYLPSEKQTTFVRLPAPPPPWSTSGSWTQKASMQQARSGLGVASVNGKIYAIGGTTASGFMPSIPGSAVLGNRDIGGHVGTNEEYDPETDTWTYKASMPTPRIVFATAVYQNRIYCIGGKTADGYTEVNEVYDPATDTWETRTAMPTARGWLTANVVDNKIYVISGTSNEVYDTETDSWTTKTPSPLAASFVGGCASSVFDKKIIVIGGITSDQNYNLNQIYDTKTDTWSNGTLPPSSVGGGFAAATTGVFAPKLIYVFGKPSNLRQGEEQTFVRIYDPETDNWTFGSDAPTGRYNFGVAVLNDTFYVIGGHIHHWIPGDFAPSATNEQYTPADYIPEFPSWIILPLFFVATLVGVVVKRKAFRPT